MESQEIYSLFLKNQLKKKPITTNLFKNKMGQACSQNNYRNILRPSLSHFVKQAYLKNI